MPGIVPLPPSLSYGQKQPQSRDADLPLPSACHARFDTGRCECGSRRPLAVMLGMRSGRRPQFEGRWHCRRGCLSDAVAAAVRREFRMGATGESPVRHRVPLGLILQARGLVTRDQLRIALALQQQTGERMGDLLVRSLCVEERRVAEALAAQWNCPVWHISATPSMELLRVAPLAILRSAGTLPIRLVGRRLSLAAADGLDAPLALALERMHGLTVESGIAQTSSLETVWKTLDTLEHQPAEEVRCIDAAEITERIRRTVEQLQPVESRAVRVGRRVWLRVWLETAALEGGPCQKEDIVDYLFSLPSADRPAGKPERTPLFRDVRPGFHEAAAVTEAVTATEATFATRSAAEAIPSSETVRETASA